MAKCVGEISRLLRNCKKILGEFLPNPKHSLLPNLLYYLIPNFATATSICWPI